MKQRGLTSRARAGRKTKDLDKLREELDTRELTRYLARQIAHGSSWARLSDLDVQISKCSNLLLRLPPNDARRQEFEQKVSALSLERSQLIAEDPHLVPIRIPAARPDSVADDSEREQRQPFGLRIEPLNAVPTQDRAIVERKAQTDAERQPSAVSTTSSDRDQELPPRKRGRPQKIPDDLKERALGVQGARERAKILYQKPYPTPQEIKNVYAILRHHLARKKSRERPR